MISDYLFKALNLVQSRYQNHESIFCALVASTSFVEPDYQDTFVFVMTQVFTSQICSIEQLNIICEFNPFYINQLKEETGMHLGVLRETAQTGGITADIITNALLRHKYPAVPLQPYEFDRVIGNVNMNHPIKPPRMGREY